ncbi:hypothetical protein Hdeb2414_s0082g00780541 [Helianthus debilis subsp. tardiflorus]
MDITKKHNEKLSCVLHNGYSIKHNKYQTKNTMKSIQKTQSMTTDKRHNEHKVKPND